MRAFRVKTIACVRPFKQERSWEGGVLSPFDDRIDLGPFLIGTDPTVTARVTHPDRCTVCEDDQYTMRTVVVRPPETGMVGHLEGVVLVFSRCQAPFFLEGVCTECGVYVADHPAVGKVG